MGSIFLMQFYFDEHNTKLQYVKKKSLVLNKRKFEN